MVETIPLHEILCVCEVHEDNAFSQRRSSFIMSFSSSFEKNPKSEIHDSHRPNELKHRKFVARQLQIKTIPDGFNGGRTYSIRTLIAAASESLLEQLSHAASVAKKLSDRKSRYIRCQEAVKTVQESTFFQSCMVFFIITVSFMPSIFAFHSRYFDVHTTAPAEFRHHRS